MSDLARDFATAFGFSPTHQARAPGRVNLIGEHTDYNDLPVFPMALQWNVQIALRPRSDGVVRLHNTRADFDPVEFEIAPGIEASPPGDWSNYVKAPANELARRCAIWRGFDGLLTSDVPVAAGLSSSSAVVTAVGLALAHVNEVAVDDPLEPAEIFADAERFTGTRGGGMDQAISLAGRAGCAVRIDFAPLRITHVPVPEDWCFVVADTGHPARKSGPAQKLYNLRRAECEEALDLLGTSLVEGGSVPRRPNSYPQLLRVLGPDEALLAGERTLDGNLLKRFRHVIGEAKRVDAAVDLLRAAEPVEFGNLMDASHASLRVDYLVSSGELDELVELAMEGGAYGARLTGAGLGGCIVALADRGSVEDVLSSLLEGYYRPRGLAEDIDNRLFVAIPSEGASFGPLSPEGEFAENAAKVQEESAGGSALGEPSPERPQSRAVDHLSTGFEDEVSE